jgi:plasmid maintenance system antidote protein VapI
MKTAFEEYNRVVSSIPAAIHKEVEMQMAVSNRIYKLMVEKGLSKAEFARAIGKRPCEITKWLSGQHNFTLSTLGMLSAFFGQPIITVQYNYD